MVDVFEFVELTELGVHEVVDADHLDVSSEVEKDHVVHQEVKSTHYLRQGQDAVHEALESFDLDTWKAANGQMDGHRAWVVKEGHELDYVECLHRLKHKYESLEDGESVCLLVLANDVQYRGLLRPFQVDAMNTPHLLMLEPFDVLVLLHEEMGNHEAVQAD